MNTPRERPNPRICPSCGAPLNADALVCPSCGGVTAIEIASERLLQHMAGEARRLIPYLRNRAALVWILALIPILIVPPIIAILVMYGSADDDLRNFDRTLAATVAVLNVIVSFIFWHRLGHFTLGFGPGLWFFLKSLGVGHAPIATPTPI
jgi:predicted RNA-binding Zn-ribbon protein involved in translation (DUF1610 family)